MSCEECRANYQEDDRDPPCEEKGHCPIGAVDLLPENQEALELWHKIKAFGPELVFKLLNLKLSELEAENLLGKLSLIEATVNEFQAESKE